jgi:hypothetical protein
MTRYVIYRLFIVFVTVDWFTGQRVNFSEAITTPLVLFTISSAIVKQNDISRT